MRRILLVAAALTAATPLTARVAPAPPVIPASPSPAATATDPATLAAAERVANRILPPRAYAKVMQGMIGPLVDGMMGGLLDLSLGETGGAMAGSAGGRGGEQAKAEARAGSGQTLRQVVEKEDPHYAERLRITSRIMRDAMGPVYGAVEINMRRGLAQAYARRYTAAELTDLDRFYATPLGGKVAADWFFIWMDPELVKASMSAMPELMRALPGIEKEIEAATAHLPARPKRRSKDKGDEEERPEPVG